MSIKEQNGAEAVVINNQKLEPGASIAIDPLDGTTPLVLGDSAPSAVDINPTDQIQISSSDHDDIPPNMVADNEMDVGISNLVETNHLG